MSAQTKDFHLDTIISAMTGKLFSRIAEKEYPSLCSYLFKNHPIPHHAVEAMPNTGDLPLYVTHGLIHECRGFHETLLFAFQSAYPGTGPKQHIGNIRKIIRDALHIKSDIIVIHPFSKETVEGLCVASAHLQNAALKMKAEAFQNGTPNTIMLPASDYLGKVLEDLGATSRNTRDSSGTSPPRNLRETEPSALQAFEGLEYAAEIQTHILSIARKLTIPITPASFRKLPAVEGSKSVQVLGIDVPEKDFDKLSHHPMEAGIGKYITPIPPNGSDRRTLTVNVQKLEDNFLAIMPLSSYGEKIGRNGRRYEGR